MSVKWSPLEHKIWKSISAAGLDEHAAFLVAVSGGLDSMVLLHMLLRLKPRAQFHVVYFHHGPSEDQAISQFRDECENLVQKSVRSKSFLASGAAIRVSIGRSERMLTSEQEYREARWNFIRRVQGDGEIVVTAHHLNDRLETMLLQMIRGSSLAGITGFKMWNGEIFRPFLEINKSVLREYATENQIQWLEDPTNLQSDYLRNWLREEWLPMLEKKVNGGADNLTRSLLRIVDEAPLAATFDQEFAVHYSGNSLNRVWWQLRPKNEQLRALVLFLKSQNIHEFTSGQIEEIRKRLDKNQKDITFEILQRKWVINASHIVLV